MTETNYIKASKTLPARTIISNKFTLASPARSSKKTCCSDLNALSTIVLESSIALSIRSSRCSKDYDTKKKLIFSLKVILFI